MKQPSIRHLKLSRAEFDPAVLPAGNRGGTEPALRDAISNYVREQFAKLDGVINTLSVDENEINVSWTPAERESPAEAIVALLKKGQYPEAVLLMKFFLSDMPEDTILLYNLGMALSDLKQLDQAILTLRRLLELEPGHVNGRIALGVALDRQGGTESAAAELRRAVTDDPSNPWAHRNLGASLLKLGQTEEGVVHLRRAAELNPEDSLAWLGLAQALELAGDGAGADAAYLRVLAIDEYSDLAEMARQGRSKIAQKNFRAKMPNAERPDAVMYCLGALQRFEKMSPAEVQKIGFEIAILGAQGLDVIDSTPKYHLRRLPGEFSGLHLVSIMYVAFKQIAPDKDVGFDLSAEYRVALSMYKAEAKK